MVSNDDSDYKQVFYKMLCSCPSRASKCFTRRYIDDEVELYLASTLARIWNDTCVQKAINPRENRKKHAHIPQYICIFTSVFLESNDFPFFLHERYVINIIALKNSCMRNTSRNKCFPGEVHRKIHRKSTQKDSSYSFFIYIWIF